MIAIPSALALQVGRLRDWLRIVRLRFAGATLGQGCQIGARVDVQRGAIAGRKGQISLGQRVRLDHGVILHAWGGNISLGDDVFLGPYTVVYGHGGVTIGNNTLIAMHCRIVSSNHTVPERGIMIRSQPDILLPTRIGSDVWLGAGVTVLGGVAVGDGCVVAAGAVVTEDLPPYAVAVGVPARVVRYRT
jgi:acetyltransferase-like isoleucine patch superfamily enzyme